MITALGVAVIGFGGVLLWSSIVNADALAEIRAALTGEPSPSASGGGLRSESLGPGAPFDRGLESESLGPGAPLSPGGLRSESLGPGAPFDSGF